MIFGLLLGQVIALPVHHLVCCQWFIGILKVHLVSMSLQCLYKHVIAQQRQLYEPVMTMSLYHDNITKYQ